MTSPQIELVRLLLADAPLPERGPVADLALAHPDGVARARALVAAGVEPPATPAATAALFDRLARVSPEAAVALYSLGDPDLLDAATGELVAVVESWARPPEASSPARVLDFGCGIGRVARALAMRGARVTGLDVSPAMIAEARARGGGVDYVVADGAGALPDGGFDLIVAADSFPYLVASGLIDRTLADMARVLRPGGRLIVFHWSYRGDPAADIAEAGRLAASSGLELLRAGERPFRIWDAPGFLLEKRG